jgi:hypothetical protein
VYVWWLRTVKWDFFVPFCSTHGTPNWGPSQFIKQFQRKRSQKFARGVLSEVSQKFVAARGSVQRAHARRALSTIRDETVPAAAKSARSVGASGATTGTPRSACQVKIRTKPR